VNALSPPAERSVNRFADFENGVVFWKRGSSAAQALLAWMKSSQGAVTSLSAAQVVWASYASLGPTLSRLGTAVPSFGGTTPYVWDGAGVQNRRHKIHVDITSVETSVKTSIGSGGIFGIGAAVETIETVRTPRLDTATLYVLVTYEPLSRKVVGCLTDYETSWGSFSLSAALEPLLWSSFDILTLPDSDAGVPVAVLSVKTMPNGDVNTYIEP
jgi:hypothetical protein